MSFETWCRLVEELVPSELGFFVEERRDEGWRTHRRAGGSHPVVITTFDCADEHSCRITVLGEHDFKSVFFPATIRGLREAASLARSLQ